MKIVMADDDADDRYLVLFAFKRLQTAHTLEFVNNGRELVDYLNSRKEFITQLPDLILLDLNMPEKNGREVLKEIKEDSRLKHLDVIIFSTSNSSKDMNDAINLGASKYITKPSNLSKLMETLNQLCSEWKPSKGT